MLYNIPGEWSYSTDLMWKEQEVRATVIGVDKSAGVRKADGTLNDSWCRLGYLWTLNLRPTEQARTRPLPNSESREKNPSVVLHCFVVLQFRWLYLWYYSHSLLLYVCLSPPAPSSLPFEVAEPMVPLLRPWWMEMDIIVLGTVGCASVVFLLSAIIICYKAIKRLDVTILFSVPFRTYSYLWLKYLKMKGKKGNWNCGTHGRVYYFSWVHC